MAAFPQPRERSLQQSAAQLEPNTGRHQRGDHQRPSAYAPRGQQQRRNGEPEPHHPPHTTNARGRQHQPRQPQPYRRSRETIGRGHQCPAEVDNMRDHLAAARHSTRNTYSNDREERGRRGPQRQHAERRSSAPPTSTRVREQVRHPTIPCVYRNGRGTAASPACAAAALSRDSMGPSSASACARSFAHCTANSRARATRATLGRPSADPLP